jgi:hypothetical protein
VARAVELQTGLLLLDGQLRAELPPELVLYTLFASACDPVLALLRQGGQYSDEQIVELLIATCFGGLAA